MQVEINGETFALPPAAEEKLLQDFWTMLAHLYETRLGDKEKAGLMMITRAMLLKAEIEARAKVGKEAALRFRPPRKADPNLFIAESFLPQAREALGHATIHIDTEASGNRITALNLTLEGAGAGGRLLDSAGNAGVGQDDRAAIP